MKIKNLVWIAIFSIGFISCHDLDLTPKGLIGEAELFTNEDGVRRYFTGLYGFMPIEDFHYMTNGGDGYRSGSTWGNWEFMKYCLQNASGEFVNSWTTSPNVSRNYWPYEQIREVNVFINGFPEYRDKWSERRYNELLAEARFIRAYMYFGLAKYLGGVPIITKVQYPTDPMEELMVPREKEYDTWKFIYEELKFAMDNMADEVDVHRATRYTAAAAMSRAMLYAGSIAKYSQYLRYDNEQAYEEGYAGMQPNQANEFFGYSLQASKFLVESGKFSLYNKYSDKIQNYVELFLDPSSSENIFVKSYFPMGIVDPRNTYLIPHNWDAGLAPNPDMSSFVGSNGYPSLDFVRMFELPDNWIIDPDGNPKRFNSRGEIRDGLEPRLRAIVYFNGDQLRGKTFEIQRGLYTKFPWPASAITNGEQTEIPNQPSNSPEFGKRVYNSSNSRYQYYVIATDNIVTVTTGDPPAGSVRILSDHGTFNRSGGENNCLTGMYVRKYVKYSMATEDVREHRSDQSWIAFRLGEIYLNLAEAAAEMGDNTTAAEYIKRIRERAGCKNVNLPIDNTDVGTALYGYPLTATLQYIRDERYRELWAENHRWYDLRRWRTADYVLNRYIPRILSCYYVIDEGKFIYLDEREMNQRTWTANRNIYYLGIASAQFTRNPNLYPQNPLR